MVIYWIYSLFLVLYLMMKSKMIVKLAVKISYHVVPASTSSIIVYHTISVLTALNLDHNKNHMPSHL